MKNSICNFSEIAPLKKVLMHRPGDEFLNLTPNTLERLLFDDIPYLKVAKEEHDAYANALRAECIFATSISKQNLLVIQRKYVESSKRECARLIIEHTGEVILKNSRIVTDIGSNEPRLFSYIILAKSRM